MYEQMQAHATADFEHAISTRGWPNSLETSARSRVTTRRLLFSIPDLPFSRFRSEASNNDFACHDRVCMFPCAFRHAEYAEYACVREGKKRERERMFARTLALV